uniref:NAD(P)H-quinone oxidoreductase subunit 2, chloroplastic n=1 Tax=Anthurium amnicola TaxID=1678845 RepID=A0A1D1YDR9_9ARAE
MADNKSSFMKFLSGIKMMFTAIVFICALITLSALISITNHLIKVENDTRQAYLVELLTQILNGFFMLLSLTVAHTRIIPFITVIQLISKGKDQDSTYFIKKQKLIQKYASWYDDRCVSLSYLLFLYSLWIINLILQASITAILVSFSTYKDGVVVLPMITLKPRPTKLMGGLVILTIGSSVLIGLLSGYKMYQARKIRKSDPPTVNDSAV